MTVELERPVQRAQRPRQRAQQRRLADAVRSNEADEVARADGEVEAFEHAPRAAAPAVADDEIPRFDRHGAHAMNAPFRARRRTSTTTGAPMSAVTALSGRRPWRLARRARICAISATAAPRMMTAGTSARWSEVPRRPRARCGTATPRKTIGPQNAVTTPASVEAPARVAIRIARVLSPIDRAYSSPRRSALSCLVLAAATAMPRATNGA